MTEERYVAIYVAKVRLRNESVSGTTLSACHERAGACKRGTPVRFLACIGVKERAPA
jgi:hypothetical protein